MRMNRARWLRTWFIRICTNARYCLFSKIDRAVLHKKNTYIIVFLNHAFFTAIIILIKAAYVYSPTFNYWQSRRSRFIRIYVLYIRHCARAVACHVHILRVLITRIISIRRRPFAQPLPLTYDPYAWITQRLRAFSAPFPFIFTVSGAIFLSMPLCFFASYFKCKSLKIISIVLFKNKIRAEINNKLNMWN